MQGPCAVPLYAMGETTVDGDGDGKHAAFLVMIANTTSTGQTLL